jgi:hypothetical protein
VEKYLREAIWHLQALLMLNNAPRHPQTLIEPYPNMKVVYLPPNMTLLLQ